MNALVGLVGFSVGLGLFVFPRAAARAVGGRIGREPGHRATVGARALGALSMGFGFALLVS